MISSSSPISVASSNIWRPLNGFVSPSWTIASSALASPMRKPKRALGSRYGAQRHRLHAAADADLDVAGADLRVEDADRAHARGADLVDRLRGDLLGDAGLDLRLARGDLALAGLQDLAHDHVLDLLAADVGALQRGLDRDAAELGGVERGQAAAHLADRGAGGAEDDGLGHGAGLLQSVDGCGRDAVYGAIDSSRTWSPSQPPRCRGHRCRHRRASACSKARASHHDVDGVAARARRRRRGEGQAPPPRRRARRRQALDPRRPRQARRARRRARADRRRVGARSRPRARRAAAVLGGPAQGRPRDRRGDRRGHAAVRLPLRALQERAGRGARRTSTR